MKSQIIYLLILFVSTSYANDKEWSLKGMKSSKTPSSEQCVFTSQYFSKNSYVDKKCFFMALKNSNDRLKAESEDKKVMVVAYKNAIYISEKISRSNGTEVKIRVIAGTKSTLNQIQSVDLSVDKKYILVLDQKAAKVFSSYNHGNIGPKKQISHEKFSSINRLRFHPNKKDIIAISEKNAKLYLFSLALDSRHPAQRSKIKAQEFFREETPQLTGPSDVAVSLKRSEIYVLDRLQRKILVYSMKHKEKQEPLRAISNGKMSFPYSFSFDEKKNQFEVVNEDSSYVFVKNY